jgi:hypothetical protein
MSGLVYNERDEFEVKVQPARSTDKVIPTGRLIWKKSPSVVTWPPPSVTSGNPKPTWPPKDLSSARVSVACPVNENSTINDGIQGRAAGRLNHFQVLIDISPSRLRLPEARQTPARDANDHGLALEIRASAHQMMDNGASPVQCTLERG